MKKRLLSYSFIFLLAYCSSKPSFNDQVRQDFSSKLARVEAGLRLDSFQLLRMDSLTEKIGQIVYDSMYSREEQRLETELSSARINKGDTSYIQEEIAYMKKELDSIGNLILHADTAKKYGVLALYSYIISKNDKPANGRAWYFISNEGAVLNPDMIMDSVKLVVAQLH